MSDTASSIRRKRARVVLVVLALTVLAVGLWMWEPLVVWVTTERYYYEVPSLTDPAGNVYPPFRGWYRMQRSGARHGPEHSFWVDSGRRRHVGYALDGAPLWTVHWHPDGSLASRDRYYEKEPDTWVAAPQGEPRSTDPWAGYPEVQTEPSGPSWLLDDQRWAELIAEQQQED